MLPSSAPGWEDFQLRIVDAIGKEEFATNAGWEANHGFTTQVGIRGCREMTARCSVLRTVLVISDTYFFLSTTVSFPSH